MTVVTERGQISIPAKIRKQLNLKPGQKLRWRKVGDNECRVFLDCSADTPGPMAMLGYCTVSETRLILEANLTLATRLGATRDTLVKHPLSRFNLAAVGRELRMIELKQELNELCQQAGLPPSYPTHSATEINKAGNNTPPAKPG